MTAWQDQPPVSRRQVRQTERDENVDSQSTPEQNAPGDDFFAGIARQGWEAEARRGAVLHGPTDGSIDHSMHRGRRVQRPATNAPAADTEPEPLRYITQARPQVPSYDGASFRGRKVSAVPQDTDAPILFEPAPVEEQPTHRSDDFGPSDSRRSAVPPVGPPLNVAPPVIVPRSEPVLTRRQMRERGIGGFVTTPSENDEAERVAAAAAPSQTQPEVAPAIEDSRDGVAQAEVPKERLRFRDRASRATVDPELEREEARRAEQLAASQQAPAATSYAATEPPALIEPPARPTSTGAIPAHITAADVVAAELVEPAQAPAPADLFTTPDFSLDSVVDSEVVQSEVVVAELEPHSEQASAFEDLLFPSGQPVETAVEPVPADAMAVAFGTFLTGHDAPAPAAVPDGSIVASDGVYVPPMGHWSTQALIDDDEQVQENSFARDVGATSGAVTTSALVLPSMPTGEDIMGPLSGTGEILITGSIKLPSSMGSTGIHPARYDHSDVDALLEADDREDSSDPESAPVRAIRAVSTNTGSGDVILSMKPQKASRLPLILIVSAAVMAVGVVVLLVAGLIFKIF